jgi:hypothetical protein
MRAFGGKLTSLNLICGLSLIAFSSACSDDSTDTDATADGSTTTETSADDTTSTSTGDGDGDTSSTSTGDGDGDTTGDGDGGDGDGEMMLPDDSERDWYIWLQTDDVTFVNDVEAVSDGVLVAWTRPHNSGELGREAVITKYDTEGAEVWEEVIDSQVPCNTNCSAATDIFVTGSGDFVVAGAFRSDSTNRVDAMVAYYGSDGTQSWQQEWTGTQEDGLDDFNGVAVDPSDGSVYAVGNWENDNLRDAMLVKFDSSGNEVWSESLDGAATASADNLAGVTVAANGDVIITGRIEAAMLEGGDQLVVARYDSSGTEQWTDTHDETASLYDRGDYAEQVGDNTFIVGTVDSGNLERHDIWFALYDASGNQTWAHKYDGPVTGDCQTQSIFCDFATDGDVLEDGNFAIAGAVHAEKTDRGAFLGIFNSSGSVLWERLEEGEVDYRDSFNGVSQAADGSLYAGGYLVRGNGDGEHTDFFLAKYSPEY